ncbi:hypothetical protein OPV22_003861 [Ensete ventricosum]|uniref:Uncharacterized protein n=1 Tax=Ensete ventricosum TaxID=4639 RepID=A0AAV8S239_ENSVE|nr:hypothetical protein OPV22_003861 [Ensete ventricosum]
MGGSLVMAAEAILLSRSDFLLAFVCFVFCYYLCQIFRRSNVPVDWPVAGMLPGLLLRFRRIYEWGTCLLREVGCTFVFRGPWLLGMNYVVTCDPANLQHVFSAGFSNYPKGEEFSEIFDVLGDGIFNSDGESWKKQRMRAHGLISSRSFRSFVAGSSRRKVEQGLIPLLDGIARQGTVVDLQDVFLRLTFDSTCHLVFGVDPCCLSIEFPTIPFARAMDDAMGALFLRHIVPPALWKLMKWLGIGEEKKLATAWKEMDRFIAERIAEKKKQRSLGKDHIREGEGKLDLLSSYIDDHDDEQQHTSQQESSRFDKLLRDTTMNLMLAGRDTTGAGLTWFFWLLCTNPTVEFRILEELKKAAPLRNERSSSDDLVVFDAEELSKLVYLHAALCESLRLFPPVPFEHKAALQHEVLPSGHGVGPGTKILIPLHAMARMEGIWGEDCLEFKPERWISEKGRMRHEPSYKFLSFNSGPRTCLGKEVAFTQMKTVVAAMVYNFHVEVLQGHVVEPKLSIILHMKNGLRVRIKRRTHEGVV